eukprot:GFUD01042334.1.p1 GENE.GFUD01042334.1~~GFUD01042334.1.p1  ORF type:complete len:749 (-),score=165.53 GFUD01042334.1:67-2313(-)
MGKKTEFLGLLNYGKNNKREYTQLATEEKDIEQSKNNQKKDEDESPGQSLPYPKQIFFIISMETCERFSYYGMNTILTIYLISLFKRTYSEEKANDVSTIFYHVYKFGCYASGLIGAALADSFVGKYRTILYIGTMYAIGQAILSFGAVGRGEGGIANFPNQPVSFIGIFLIALGTGGIKPCVVSFGADQFKVPEQAKQMATYFAMFYASINFGSMISTVATPYLRRVECMGEESCFSLAFGLPAVLMFIAVFFFFFGRNSYTRHTPDKNIVTIFFKCSWHALKRRKFKTKYQHWLDVAVDRFDQETIDDIKAVYRVGVLFLLYPMYWALYDQQGSRWTIQAMKMNGFTWGWQILPDQMQVANPILILLLIPLFDQVIYPSLGKCGLLKTPLQRVVTGCFICGLSFVISGVLELQLRKGYPDLPKVDQAKIFLHNGLECPVTFDPASAIVLGLEADYSLPSGGTMEKILNHGSYPVAGEGCEKRFTMDITLADPEESRTYLISSKSGGDPVVFRSSHEDQIEKDNEDPMPFVRLIGSLDRPCSSVVARLIRSKNSEVKNIGTFGSSTFDSEVVKMEHTKEHILNVRCDESSGWEFNHTMEYEVGASYNLFLTGQENVSVYFVTSPNSVHIFWLLPQYAVVTIGEILFSITSMEFAYSQAPPSMKSVIQALYLMTTAVGNLITMVIVEIFSAIGLEQYLEFFTFAGLMTVVSFILMWLASRYEYVYYTETEKKSVDNPGYEAEDVQKSD